MPRVESTRDAWDLLALIALLVPARIGRSAARGYDGGKSGGWTVAGRFFGSGGRKVRTPPDRVPANGRAARADGKCHRNIPPGSSDPGKGEMVR